MAKKSIVKSARVLPALLTGELPARLHENFSNESDTVRLRTVPSIRDRANNSLLELCAESAFKGGSSENLITNVSVVFNPYKKNAESVYKEVLGFLRDECVRVVPSGQLLITIGGDGTILYNKQIYRQPIFGIGTESSFICPARFDNWREKLPKALSKPKVEKRLMLTGRVGDFTLPDALNEIAVRNREHRVVRFKVNSGSNDYDFRADGVIFSTPTGSTGYSYSCGGDELDYAAREYQVVGIAPFRRAFKPMKVGEDAVVRIEAVPYKSVEIIVDGQFTYPMHQGVLEIFKSRDAEIVIV